MSATYGKPITLPIWADTGLIVVPNPAKQSTGWLNTEKPPASFFNWHQNLTGNWMRWFNERFDDDQPAWRPSTAYAINDTRTNVGNKYIVTIAGTSASSGGPTGTGTGIVDGTVTWNYVSAVSPDSFLIKNPSDGTSQLRTITTGGIQIGIGLNVGITGGLATVANKIQVGAVGAVIGGSATGVQISNGLTVASTPFAAVSDRIQIGDSNFYLSYSATLPVISFNGVAPLGSIQFDRTSSGEMRFQVGSTSRMQVRPTGVSIGFLPGSLPFEINNAATGILAATAGSFINISTWDVANPFGTDTRLKTRIQRTVAGSLGDSAAMYIQEHDASNFAGFVGFFGSSALAPLTNWTGISTTGVGIGSANNAGPPLDSVPTIFVDPTKLYINNQNFSLTTSTAYPRINMGSDFYIQRTLASDLIEFNKAGNTQLVIQNIGPASAYCRLELGIPDTTTSVRQRISLITDSLLGTSAIIDSGLSSSSLQVSSSFVGGSANYLLNAGASFSFVLATATVNVGRLHFGDDAFVRDRNGVPTENPIEMSNASQGLALHDKAGNAAKAFFARVTNQSGVTANANRCLALSNTGPYNSSTAAVQMFPTGGTDHKFIGVVAFSDIADTTQGWAYIGGTCQVRANNTQAIAQNSYLRYQSATIGLAQHVAGGAVTFVLGVPLISTTANTNVTCLMMQALS